MSKKFISKEEEEDFSKVFLLFVFSFFYAKANYFKQFISEWDGICLLIILRTFT